MKKTRYFLVSILVLALFLCVGFIHIPRPVSGTVRFDYIDNSVQELQEEDLNQLYNNMNFRILRWDNPSCGFGEDVSMTFIDEKGKEHHFWFACDTCPIIYYKEANRYFSLSKESDKEVKRILSAYGLYFPCI